MPSLRPYTDVDHPACLAIFDANVPEYFSEDERVAFEAFLTGTSGTYLVVEDEGEIVGCGGYAFEPDGTTASLCWGMIHPTRHREGLGRALLEARVAAATEDPACASVRLGTIPKTVGFFERMGFEVVSVMPDGLAPGVDDVEMVWRRAGAPPASADG